MGTVVKEQNSVCPGCGQGFRCGAVGKDEGCWCFDLPQGKPVTPGGTACYCEDCLRKLKGLPGKPTAPA